MNFNLNAAELLLQAVTAHNYGKIKHIDKHSSSRPNILLNQNFRIAIGYTTRF